MVRMWNNKVLTLSLLLLSLVVSVQAQSKTTQAGEQTQDASKKAADEREQFRRDFIKATEEYKKNLQNLSTSYEKELRRLSEQNGKLRELYNDGIIARRELEASDNSLAEARAKVEAMRKQVESVDTVLEAAKKGPEPDKVINNSPVVAEVTRPVHSWTTGNKSLDNLIRYYGGRYGVDPYLIYCVMHQESRFGALATSTKGAQGLMQLMPGTAARYGVTNPYDPAQNIMGGTRYLKDLLQLFNGRIDLVLAGYNAGEGAVMKYRNNVPPYRETQNYVRSISSRYMDNSTVKPTVKVGPTTRQRRRK